MEDGFCIDLLETQIDCFQAQGFLSICQMTTTEELAWLRDVYDEIVKQELGYTPDELARAAQDDQPTFGLFTAFSPDKAVPALTHTCLARNAHQLVAYLLDVEEAQLINEWRFTFKPAHGGGTAWHQDVVHHPVPHEGASVWITLDPATIDSGCLRYIPGSHFGEIRPHDVSTKYLATADVNLAQAVACPVAAGAAIVHHCRTLHGAGSNQTNRPRRAIQIIYRVVDRQDGRRP